MNPPLRAEADRAAMLEGLRDGTIDCIATDHAPHTQDDKNVEYDQAAFGIVGLETAVPLCLDRLVAAKVVGLARLVELLSTNPARTVDCCGRGQRIRGAADPGRPDWATPTATLCCHMQAAVTKTTRATSDHIPVNTGMSPNTIRRSSSDGLIAASRVAIWKAPLCRSIGRTRLTVDRP
jgi:hypothetical protein